MTQESKTTGAGQNLAPVVAVLVLFDMITIASEKPKTRTLDRKHRRESNHATRNTNIF
jgi:hypothetical protein